MFGVISDIATGLSKELFAQERQDDAQQFTTDQNAATRTFNAQQAAEQRNFEKEMSNTRYQRAVADMKAAGLNPMLAYHQGGATSSGGAAASAAAGGAGIASPGSTHSVQAGMQSASQVDLNRAAEERTRAEADKIRAEQKEIEARTPTHAVSIEQMQQNIRESQERIHKIIQETSTSAHSAANLAQQTINLKEVIPQIRATVDNLKAHTKLHGAETEKATAQTREINQRISANLPALEAALANLERLSRELAVPGRQQESSVQDSYVGSLGATLRALNPFNAFFGSIPSTTIINRR